MLTLFGGTTGTFEVPSVSTSPFNASPFRNSGSFEGMNPFENGDFGGFGNFPRGMPFSGMESMVGAIFVGMLVFWLAVTLVLSLLSLISMWKLFRKAGQPGWKSIIPVYNMYVMLKISGCPGWWLALYFVPYVNLIVAVLAADAFVKAYGRLGIGPVLMYVFLAPFYLPYLAFSRNVRYMGPFPWGSGFYGGVANVYGDPLGPNYQPSAAGSYPPGYPQGYAQGYMPAYNPSYNQGVNPVNQPGVNPGYNPGYNTENQPAANGGNMPASNPAYNMSAVNQPPVNPPTVNNPPYAVVPASQVEQEAMEQDVLKQEVMELEVREQDMLEQEVANQAKQDEP